MNVPIVLIYKNVWGILCNLDCDPPKQPIHMQTDRQSDTDTDAHTHTTHVHMDTNTHTH